MTQDALHRDGPGRRLKELFTASGAPFCEACEQLALQMDVWGAKRCREHIEEIVADIMPRALAWEAEKLGWMSKLIPDVVTAVSIRALVTRAINTADQSKKNDE